MEVYRTFANKCFTRKFSSKLSSKILDFMFQIDTDSFKSSISVNFNQFCRDVDVLEIAVCEKTS